MRFSIKNNYSRGCLALIPLALGLAILACNMDDDPIPPCEQTLTSDQVQDIQDRISSIPALQELYQSSLSLSSSVNDCVRKGQVQGYINLSFGAENSDYGVAYQTTILLDYQIDPPYTITPTWSSQPIPLDENAIMKAFGETIRAYESVPELEEYLQKQKPVPASLDANSIRYYTENLGSSIVYSLAEQRLLAYSLPNAISWELFPEIETTKRIVQQDLLVGEWAQCQIGQGDFHANTQMETIYDKPALAMRVNLHCGNSLHDAVIELYPDGHYENPRIE